MKYEITKEQIETLFEHTNNYYLHQNLKEWFPEAFKTVLELGKWYKSINGVLKFFVTNETAYGFNSEKKWSDLSDNYDLNNLDKSRVSFDFKWKEASESEVFEALKNEAVKRGYVGNHIIMIEGNIGKISNVKMNNNFEYENGRLMNLSGSGYTIFKKGEWAEIFETITKEEAEKLLNKKII